MARNFTTTPNHPNAQQARIYNGAGVCSQRVRSAPEKFSLAAHPHNSLSRLNSPKTRGLEEALRRIYVKATQGPRFSKGQLVSFIGGIGTVISCQINSGTWTYAVEMALGPEPEMGRIGSETTILLHESDIQGAVN